MDPSTAAVAARPSRQLTPKAVGSALPCVSSTLRKSIAASPPLSTPSSLYLTAFGSSQESLKFESPPSPFVSSPLAHGWSIGSCLAYPSCGCVSTAMHLSGFRVSIIGYLTFNLAQQHSMHWNSWAWQRELQRTKVQAVVYYANRSLQTRIFPNMMTIRLPTQVRTSTVDNLISYW